MLPRALEGHRHGGILCYIWASSLSRYIVTHLQVGPQLCIVMVYYISTEVGTNLLPLAGVPGYFDAHLMMS